MKRGTGLILNAFSWMNQLRLEIDRMRAANISHTHAYLAISHETQPASHAIYSLARNPFKSLVIELRKT